MNFFDRNISQIKDPVFKRQLQALADAAQSISEPLDTRRTTRELSSGTLGGGAVALPITIYYNIAISDAQVFYTFKAPRLIKKISIACSTVNVTFSMGIFPDLPDDWGGASPITFGEKQTGTIWYNAPFYYDPCVFTPASPLPVKAGDVAVIWNHVAAARRYTLHME